MKEESGLYPGSQYHPSGDIGGHAQFETSGIQVETSRASAFTRPTGDDFPWTKVCCLVREPSA